jgi:predicted NBD/HSP70 family sugar kinase
VGGRVLVDSNLLKQISRQRILSLLQKRKVLSRAEIARLAGLTRSTITQHTAELIAEGILKEHVGGDVEPVVGRPGVPLVLCAEGASFIGADIAVERLSIIKLDLTGRIVTQVSEALDATLEPETVLARLAELVQKVNTDGASEPGRISGVGITAPASFTADGTLLAAPRLGWSQVPVRQLLEQRLPWPLFFDNEANASALAETFHARSINGDNLIYILLDTGVCGGIVIGGQLYRGGGFAGEIGHLPVSLDGPLCSCGNAGCLEAWIGKPALLQRYEMASGNRVSLETLETKAAGGDAMVLRVLDEWSTWIARGLLGLVNVLNPGRLVIGGPLSILLPYVEKRLNHELNRYSWPTRERIEVETSQFGAYAVAVGAATLAQQSYFDVPDLVFPQRVRP